MVLLNGETDSFRIGIGSEIGKGHKVDIMRDNDYKLFIDEQLVGDYGTYDDAKNDAYKILNI